jgi:hypothetical protein
MNEIEKAIQDLSELQRQFEYSINEAKCGNDDAIEAFGDNKSAVHSLKFAITALREKAEREKGDCNRCQSGKYNFENSHYCSLCGRRLDVDK